MFTTLKSFLEPLLPQSAPRAAFEHTLQVATAVLLVEAARGADCGSSGSRKDFRVVNMRGSSGGDRGRTPSGAPGSVPAVSR